MYVKQEKNKTHGEGQDTFLSSLTLPDIFVQMFNTLKPRVTHRRHALITKPLTPSHPIVIVFLVNNSLQNAKEKFEVKDFERKC
jgi:hypothetical protein